MKQLILNADDFGLTSRLSQGIIEAIIHGQVSATTAMVCGPEGIQHIRQLAPRLSDAVGLHLQLTDGIPISPAHEISTLITPQGRFPRKSREINAPAPEQIYREWRAQLGTLREAGVEPTHMDTHHSIHDRPDVFPVYCQLAAETGLPARGRSPNIAKKIRAAGAICADMSELRWYERNLSVDGLLQILDDAFEDIGGHGTIECMCHPGWSDDQLNERSNYSTQRELELEILCSPVLAAELDRRGIVVVSPKQFAEALTMNTER